MLQSAKSTPPSEISLYLRVLLFGLATYGVLYAYTSAAGIPQVLNKSAADTSVVLMGLSMLLSSICYFWDRFDSFIRYRKQLGLIGFAFGVAHIVLSFSALQSYLNHLQTANWPVITGLTATVIFTVMALISNSLLARLLGGRIWRTILRTGYLALFLIFLHVVLLKSGRWITWYQGGMKTLPSTSLMVSAFILVVVIMRIALWISLKRRQSALL